MIWLNGGVFPFVIAIHGQKRTGKDTVATLLAQEITARIGFKNVHGSVPPVRIDQFAYPGKQFLSEHFGTTEENKDLPVEGLPGKTHRDLLKSLLSGWGRRESENIWTVLALQRAKKAAALGTPITIISDLRFKNEAQLIQEGQDNQGRIVQVQRRDVRDLNPGHESEKGIPSYMVDHFISNESNLRDLYEKTGQVLQDHLIPRMRSWFGEATDKPLQAATGEHKC